ncbi:hypothetical protein GDO81_027958 [Engystomops pustulosus]|uniref:Uncharacterized protein n=1 Tax=Engystomops pustulosus TaxID=76066 RepID=A0AAV6ZSA5_ENGPU|nr:hypothetical protein GDO81_027958 [Engystomops pustulosus]
MLLLYREVGCRSGFCCLCPQLTPLIENKGHRGSRDSFTRLPAAALCMTSQELETYNA